MLHTASVSSVSSAGPATAAPPSHHLDHLDLLMLYDAIARVTDRFLGTGSLSEGQRAVLTEYRDDVLQVSARVGGPAREYADQLAALESTVLDAPAGRATGRSGHSAAA